MKNYTSKYNDKKYQTKPDEIICTNERLNKETFENAYFASVNKQKNFVYVEAGKNYSQDQIYHLSFDGKRIFVLDKLEEFHLVTYYLKELFYKQCKMYMMGM